MQRLPLSNDARQSLVTSLEGQEVLLRLWWQPSDTSWYATLEMPVGTPLIAGRRLALDEPIIGTRPTAFAGDIYCRRVGVTAEEPARRPWGITHALIFEP